VGFGPEHPHVVHQGDLHTSATQVGENPLTPGQIHPAGHGQMYQSGLLGSGDHLQIDPRLVHHPIHQLLAVFGLPHGTGRYSSEGVQLQPLHLVPEGGEGSHCPFHGLWG